MAKIGLNPKNELKFSNSITVPASCLALLLLSDFAQSIGAHL